MCSQVLLFRKVVLPDDISLSEVKWDGEYSVELVLVGTLKLRVIGGKTVYVV